MVQDNFRASVSISTAVLDIQYFKTVLAKYTISLMFIQIGPNKYLKKKLSFRLGKTVKLGNIDTPIKKIIPVVFVSMEAV
jgi:hypothetical protein